MTTKKKKPSKSPRHPKITGDFGEYFVLYWLSKNGFESVHVDHTGIDIIAVHRKTKKRMGISVKSTGTFKGKYIYPDKQLEDACKKFMLEPYYAILSDVEPKLCVCILSKDELFKKFEKHGKKDYRDFKMNENDLKKYRKNPKIGMIEFEYRSHNLYSI